MFIPIFPAFSQHFPGRPPLPTGPGGCEGGDESHRAGCEERSGSRSVRWFPILPKDVVTPHRIHGAAIYGNIYHQYTPNVSIYIPYMDPMGTFNGYTLW